jgi:hypothetical protein
MSEHTKEPWKVQKDFNNIFALSHGESGITIHIAKVNNTQVEGGQNEASANAERIIACVNACAGITTEALQAGVIRRLIGRNRIEKDEHGDEWVEVE